MTPPLAKLHIGPVQRTCKTAKGWECNRLARRQSLIELTKAFLLVKLCLKTQNCYTLFCGFRTSWLEFMRAVYKWTPVIYRWVFNVYLEGLPLNNWRFFFQRVRCPCVPLIAKLEVLSFVPNVFETNRSESDVTWLSVTLENITNHP